jgi:hypothetical protein
MKADEKEIRAFNDTGIYMPCFAGGSVYISADLDGRFIDETGSRYLQQYQQH